MAIYLTGCQKKWVLEVRTTTDLSHRNCHWVIWQGSYKRTVKTKCGLLAATYWCVRSFEKLHWYYDWIVIESNQEILIGVCSFECLSYLFPAQWSMTALVSHGCRVMEGDFTFDWTGGWMLLEQCVVRLCLWWRLRNSRQQGPTARNPSAQPVPQWLLGNTHGGGNSRPTMHLRFIGICLRFGLV